MLCVHGCKPGFNVGCGGGRLIWGKVDLRDSLLLMMLSDDDDDNTLTFRAAHRLAAWSIRLYNT